MTGLIVGGIILAILLVAAFLGVIVFFIVTYNKLVRLRNSVRNAMAQIDIQQQDLSEAEDKVTFARQFYNDAVTIYNNKLQMFPINLIAGMMGFTEATLLDVDDEAMEPPQIDIYK